jgi:hypothetical protein
VGPAGAAAKPTAAATSGSAASGGSPAAASPSAKATNSGVARLASLTSLFASMAVGVAIATW